MLVVLAIVAAACGDDSSVTTATPAATTTTAAPTTTTSGGTDDTTTTTAAPIALADVCPDPIIIQTDWFPEAEHGAMYEMLGDDYTIDTDNQIVAGSLVSGGEDTGIDIEVRTGGPAIGFQNPVDQMYVEREITFGYVSTDEAVFAAEDNPSLAVVAPLDKNPQIIMWDPATYPDVETIADLGTEGVTIRVFAGGTYIDVFVSEGIISQSQVDPSYDGSPAVFVAEGGKIAQQGFASAEPYNYEFEFTDWGKPVKFQLIHDAGLEIYSQAVAIRAGDLEDLRPCLEQFVPIVQEAIVDYVSDPARANAIIIDAVEQYNSFWVYSPELADYSVDTQLELGLVGDGSDDVVGNMDPERVQGVIDKMVAAGLPVKAGLQASDITTNEFIDPSIGLP
jgi:hypothetical protein